MAEGGDVVLVVEGEEEIVVVAGRARRGERGKQRKNVVWGGTSPCLAKPAQSI